MWITSRYSQGNTVFYSIPYKNDCLAVSDLFLMFTQSIKFYTFHCPVLKIIAVSKI